LYNEEVAAWQRSVSMSKYEELAKIYKMAGIDIHLLKLQPSANMTDEQLDYVFNVCKAVGAEGLCTELSLQVAERAQPFAAKHGKYIVFHNHAQFSDDSRYNNNLDFINAGGYDAYLKYDNVRFNFDMGHYYGTTKKDPREIVEKYHERIFTCHIKDKTGPDATPRGNFNQPWGQGETPLKEFLLFIKSNAGKPGWPVHCDIELEYDIPAGSNAVIETRRCVEWAKNVLLG
jgi:sugar phosphate isomerase/epimerase